MPLCLDRPVRRTELWLGLILNLVLLAGALAGAVYSDEPTHRFAFWFVTGILGVAAVLRARPLLGPRRVRLTVDADGIRWEGPMHAAYHAWQDLQAVLALDAAERYVLLEKRGGGPIRVPYEFDAGEFAQLLAVLREEVLPRHGELRLHVERPGEAE